MKAKSVKEAITRVPDVPTRIPRAIALITSATLKTLPISPQIE
jgi:hypothetical protein